MSDDSPKPPTQPRLSLTPEVALGQYANFVSIAHTFSEVLLDFGRMLPGRSDIPVVARLIVSPFHAKQFLRALEHNLRMYEQKFGAIADPPATPDLKVPEGAN